MSTPRRTPLADDGPEAPQRLRPEQGLKRLITRTPKAWAAVVDDRDHGHP